MKNKHNYNGSDVHKDQNKVTIDCVRGSPNVRSPGNDPCGSGRKFKMLWSMTAYFLCFLFHGISIRGNPCNPWLQ